MFAFQNSSLLICPYMEIVATVFTTTQVSDIVFIDKSREEFVHRKRNSFMTRHRSTFKIDFKISIISRSVLKQQHNFGNPLC